MNKLITQLTESINSKLEDVNRYSKMINLVASQDVKAMRKFIHSQDTFEKETFFEMLSYGDVEFFHKVYPYAHVGTERSFAVSVIAAQYDYDKKDELERFALDIEKIYDGMYPIDYSDAEWPDHANESEPSKVAAM
jgi:hypothetical protein